MIFPSVCMTKNNVTPQQNPQLVHVTSYEPTTFTPLDSPRGQIVDFIVVLVLFKTNLGNHERKVYNKEKASTQTIIEMNSTI